MRPIRICRYVSRSTRVDESAGIVTGRTYFITAVCLQLFTFHIALSEYGHSCLLICIFVLCTGRDLITREFHLLNFEWAAHRVSYCFSFSIAGANNNVDRYFSFLGEILSSVVIHILCIFFCLKCIVDSSPVSVC